jgi:hypothetical protein
MKILHPYRKAATKLNRLRLKWQEYRVVHSFPIVLSVLVAVWATKFCADRHCLVKIVVLIKHETKVETRDPNTCTYETQNNSMTRCNGFMFWVLGTGTWWTLLSHTVRAILTPQFPRPPLPLKLLFVRTLCNCGIRLSVTGAKRSSLSVATAL